MHTYKWVGHGCVCACYSEKCREIAFVEVAGKFYIILHWSPGARLCLKHTWNNSARCLRMVDKLKTQRQHSTAHLPTLGVPLLSHPSLNVLGLLNCLSHVTGRQFGCTLELCTCHPDAYFFVRHGVWPTKSFSPCMAFTMSFMALVDSFFFKSKSCLHN